MSKEAALILGALAALVNGIVVVAGLGAFDDGLQWEDLIPVLGPVLAAVGIREAVFSRETVAKMAAELKPVTGTTRDSGRQPGAGSTFRQGGGGPG